MKKLDKFKYLLVSLINMPIDTIVGSPEDISSWEGLEDVLSRIITYEKERSCKAGVLLIQRRQFGDAYRIKSEEEAKEWMSRPVLNNPRTCEWGLEFWPRSYFEELKGKLKPTYSIDQY